MYTIGDNSIFKVAKDARDSTNESTKKEIDYLEEIDHWMKNNGWEGNILPWNEKDSDTVKAVKSEDDVIIPVPVGFSPSEEDGEKSVENGFVIKHNKDEFVWVPVPNLNEMFGTDTYGNATGKLYNFSRFYELDENYKPLTTYTDKVTEWEYSTTRPHEPDTSSGAYFYYIRKEGESNGIISRRHSGAVYVPGLSLPTNGKMYLISKEMPDHKIINVPSGVSVENVDASYDKTNPTAYKAYMQVEFNKMMYSVAKYKGFYIGRYETGDLSQEKAVVQKGNTDIGSQNWYNQYEKSKTIAEGTGAESSMIWGCQWDATMKWFLRSKENTIREYVFDSLGKGNYSGFAVGLIATGSNPEYSVNNIYDMAGNASEWTIELASEDQDKIGNYRTSRGGNYHQTR